MKRHCISSSIRIGFACSVARLPGTVRPRPGSLRTYVVSSLSALPVARREVRQEDARRAAEASEAPWPSESRQSTHCAMHVVRSLILFFEKGR